MITKKYWKEISKIMTMPYMGGQHLGHKELDYLEGLGINRLLQELLDPINGWRPRHTLHCKRACSVYILRGW